MPSISNQAFQHALKVFLYIVGSAVLPAIVSLYAQDATFMLFTPIINALAAYLVKRSNLMAGQS